MNVNDFVENFQLNSFIRNMLSENLKAEINLSLNNFDGMMPFWSSLSFDDPKSLNYLNVKFLNSSSVQHKEKCMTKRFNFWQQEPCWSKLGFVCEFDSVKSKTQPKRPIIKAANNNNNRLIRVACGSSSTLFSSGANTAPTTTKDTNMNSIKNTQKINLNSNKLRNKQNKQIINSLKPNEYSIVAPKEISTTAESLKKKEQDSTTIYLTQANNSKGSFQLFGLDLAVVIAIVSGVSVVLVAVNIFFIWNYYK